MVLLAKIVGVAPRELVDHIIQTLATFVSTQMQLVSSRPLADLGTEGENEVSVRTLALLLRGVYLIVEEADQHLQTHIIPVFLRLIIDFINFLGLSSQTLLRWVFVKFGPFCRYLRLLLLRYAIRILRICACKLANAHLTGGYYDSGTDTATLVTFTQETTSCLSDFLYRHFCSDLSSPSETGPDSATRQQTLRALTNAFASVIIECTQTLTVLISAFSEHGDNCVCGGCSTTCIHVCFIMLTNLREVYFIEEAEKRR
jgi:hypothetical protein